MKEVALLTGITGFLGCHIGQLLIQSNYQLIATVRSSSSLENCIEFRDQITWIHIDEDNWREKVIALQPKIILHAAWIGVSAAERNDWELQCKNLVFLNDLLYIAKRSGTKKMIGLGSQAEYGYIDSVVPESHTLKPVTAYGAVKIISSQIIKNYCISHDINWYWLRIFSVFGEKEGSRWLIPAVIKTIAQKKASAMDFSPGEQAYAYLYTRDFASAIKKILADQDNKDGIYNLSSSTYRSLRNIITAIRDSMDPDFLLEFGALPYRADQSMLIAGDMTLFNAAFGALEETAFEEGIKNVINYYISNLTNESI